MIRFISCNAFSNKKEKGGEKNERFNLRAVVHDLILAPHLNRSKRTNVLLVIDKALGHLLVKRVHQVLQRTRERVVELDFTPRLSGTALRVLCLGRCRLSVAVEHVDGRGKLPRVGIVGLVVLVLAEVAPVLHVRVAAGERRVREKLGLGHFAE